MEHPELMALIDGRPFRLPSTTQVTDAPLTREMARDLLVHGCLIEWQGGPAWFGRANWLQGRMLVIPLRGE